MERLFLFLSVQGKERFIVNRNPSCLSGNYSIPKPTTVVTVRRAISFVTLTNTFLLLCFLGGLFLLSIGGTSCT
jgi:hypothetical protein